MQSTLFLICLVILTSAADADSIKDRFRKTLRNGINTSNLRGNFDFTSLTAEQRATYFSDAVTSALQHNGATPDDEPRRVGEAVRRRDGAMTSDAWISVFANAASAVMKSHNLLVETNVESQATEYVDNVASYVTAGSNDVKANVNGVVEAYYWYLSFRVRKANEASFTDSLVKEINK